MGVRRDGWLDQSELNTIRIVIGSYFCAVAMGVPSGFDPHLLVGRVWPGEGGQMLCSAALLVLSIMFIFGVMLRGSSLILSAFVIFSSAAEAILSGQGAPGAGVLQSVAFGAAVLLCYGPLKPHEMHKAALFSSVSLRGGAARVLQKNVTPRRVCPSVPCAKARRRDPGLRTLGPLIAPTERMMGLGKTDAAKDRGRPQKVPLVQDDLENIFVNL